VLGCIRWLQQSHAGCRLCIPMKKDDRELTNGPSEGLHRWHQYFSKLLNQDTIQEIPVVLPNLEFDDPPELE